MRRAAAEWVPECLIGTSGQIPIRQGGADGFRLEGVTKETLRRRAVAAIRPEDIALDPQGGITGRIEAVEYCGRDSLVDVRIPSGMLLHARLPASTAVGDAVRLHVPRQRVLVYPAEGASDLT